MINKRILFLLSMVSFLACFHQTYGQQEFTLYHMPVLAQSHYLNPASVPEHKVSLTLPGTNFFVGMNNSAFNVKAFLSKDGTVDYGKFVAGLSAQNNYLGTGMSSDLFHLRIKAANNFFSVSSRIINDTRFLYPRDFLGIASTGFDEQYNLSGLGMHSSTYIENAIGFTRVVPDSRWTYGGRFKLLSGIANVQTNRSDLVLNIDNSQNYTYTAEVDFQINASVGLDDTVLEEIGDISDLSGVNDYRNAIKLNKGYAIDGGVTFQHTKKLSYGLAVNNVGFINWASFARNYNSQFTTTFEGVVIEDFDNIEEQVDSLVDAYDEVINDNTDTTREAYKTWLPSSIFLSAHYQLSPKVRASGSIYAEIFRGISLGGTAALNISLSNSLDFTTSWWYLRKSAANMGVGLVFKPGWAQFHLVMDNVLPTTFVNINDEELGVNNLLLPYQAKNFNLRFGVNFVFGRIKNESMLPAQGLRKRKHGFRKYLYKPSSN